VTDTETLRRQLVTANRILANEGIIQGFGHVSSRIPDTDTMLISQSRSPAFVTEADIIEMDFDGNVVGDEDVRTYKESVIHRAIYRHRDDVNAVVHHHAPAVMPFTVTDIEIQPVYHLGALFHEGVPKFQEYDPEFGRLVVTEAEGERMAEVLGNNRAQLIEGHGANVTGATLKEAILATSYFVTNSRYQYQALQIGDPDYYTEPKESIENIIEDIIFAPIAIDRMWNYLYNRLPDTEQDGW
jgi:ribulose-5-phosphate 4-epimerase/fuculose-1-phosphate aldolase